MVYEAKNNDFRVGYRDMRTNPTRHISIEWGESVIAVPRFVSPYSYRVKSEEGHHFGISLSSVSVPIALNWGEQ